MNIIINFGAPASEYEMCAADLNGDSIVNVLDVLVIVNIILDDNRRMNHRVEAIEQIDVILNENDLVIASEGFLRGLQLKIKSKSDILHFNKNLGMDIAVNKYDDIHSVIIYSIDGNYLYPGEYLLFESKFDFEVLEFIASNSNNEQVFVTYENNFQPNIFLLKQNYPNPFNPKTTIEIELGVSEHIRLVVYDINGRQIKEIANGLYNEGSHSFTWDSKDDYGNSVSSGMYIYSLISNDNISNQKMLLLK